MSCKLTILVDNTVKKGSDLTAEHGLAIFVETPDLSFLFDCGHTGIAWNNAEKLSVDLSSVDFVVLSHSHYDHAGGFPSLLKYCHPKAVYIGRNFWQEKFSFDKESNQYLPKGCGFTKSDLVAWDVEEHECKDSLKLDDYAQLFTNFDRHYSFEHIPPKFVCGSAKESDCFDDEICLLLKADDGIALVVGCSHQGILNITATVKKRTGLPVRRIIGGIHLNGEGQERMDRTLNELKRLGVRDFNLCHCSGVNVLGRVSAGTVIKLD